jgi:hypothetical protein
MKLCSQGELLTQEPLRGSTVEGKQLNEYLEGIMREILYRYQAHFGQLAGLKFCKLSILKEWQKMREK